MVVLIADKGCGKTSALKAIQIALGSWEQGFMGTRSAPFDQTMKHHGSQHKNTTSTIAVTALLGRTDEISWLCVPDKRSRSSQKTHRIQETARALLHAGGSLPLIAYYNACTTPPKSMAKKHTGPQPRYMGYDRALMPPVDYEGRWGRWLRLVLQAREREDARSVHKALVGTLTSLLPGVSQVKFHYDLGEPVVTFKNGNMQVFSALGKGFQKILGIGSDIALRSIQLNPQLNDMALQNTTGVVLIDDIERHLHPAWQAQVAVRLRSAFPALQFIMTTNSQIVASGADPVATTIKLHDKVHHSSPSRRTER